jgi:hypothetical protein
VIRLPWTRRGTDSFLGQKNCQGREEIPFEKFSHALILIGDWCGPKSYTDRKENRGA